MHNWLSVPSIYSSNGRENLNMASIDTLNETGLYNEQKRKKKNLFFNRYTEIKDHEPKIIS